MSEYHIRYTCSGDLQNSVIDFISRNADKYIIAKEIATREHLQCYVVMSKWCKKTWVNEFNKKIKNMDRRDKYVELDKGHTKAYVCKDGCILAKRGFTDEDIENLKTQYHKEHPPIPIIEKNIEFCDAPPLEISKKVKKSRPPTFAKQCRNELLEEFPEIEWTKKHRPLVFTKIMNNLGDGCKNLDHIIVSRLTYGVLNGLIKEKKEWHQYWYAKAFEEDFNYDVKKMDD